ncbi:MAG: hypothetical protein RLZZ522_824 [Verrucomicrobiota bacterium]|jgi:hypothetical protein
MFRQQHSSDDCDGSARGESQNGIFESQNGALKSVLPISGFRIVSAEVPRVRVMPDADFAPFYEWIAIAKL